MPKFLKYFLIGFSSVVALLVLAVVIIAATFNPNDYKPFIIKLVQDKTQRTLSLPGEIKLMYFPRIGADLGQFSLSERNSAQAFASGEHVVVSVALLPLLSKQVVVDRVLVDGLTVHIHRFKNGSSNYDDLVTKVTRKLKGQDEPQETKDDNATPHPVTIDIGGVAITHASLSYTDDVAQRKLVVSDFNLGTGPIAHDKPSNIELSAHVTGDNPKLALKFNAQTGFRPDFEQGRQMVNNFEATLNGGVADISNLQLKLSLPSVELSPTALKIPSLSIDASVKRGALSANARLSSKVDADLEAQLWRVPMLAITLDGQQGDLALKGQFNTQINANLKSQLIELSELGADLVLPNPAGGAIAFKARGKASANLDKELVQATLSGQLDDSAFEAQAELSKFSHPAYTLEFSVDKLDADHYIAKSTPSAQPDPAAAKTVDQPIDLSALQSLNLRGKLKAGALKVASVKATDIRVELLAANGKITVAPLAAKLYDGRVAGAVTATTSKPSQFSARLSLDQIKLGPLLKDALDLDLLNGQGDVALDISSTGTTVSQLKKELNGTARLALKDGAVKGINLAAALRNAKAKVGRSSGDSAAQQGAASMQEQTDFTELSASFKISKGVAHNDDLSAKTPLLRVGGSGDIDLGESNLDYTVKATIVPTLKGQGGPELQALKGLTLPVKLSGPFTAINWKIDFSSAAGDRAKETVQDKASQIKAGTQKKLDEQRNRAQEQIKDKFKGLLGR